MGLSECLHQMPLLQQIQQPPTGVDSGSWLTVKMEFTSAPDASLYNNHCGPDLVDQEHGAPVQTRLQLAKKEAIGGKHHLAGAMALLVQRPVSCA
jgi:hypothetical protein